MTVKDSGFLEAAKFYKKVLENNVTFNNAYHQSEVVKTKEILDAKFDNITKSDLSAFFTSIYENYVDYLDELSPDKLVCIFNIIMFSSLFSSFFSVLSILLSENIINRITWLEKYPKILYLLKIRNKLNKKIIKAYVLTHLFFILLGLIGNLYMFFL